MLHYVSELHMLTTSVTTNNRICIAVCLTIYVCIVKIKLLQTLADTHFFSTFAPSNNAYNKALIRPNGGIGRRASFRD